MDPMRVSLLLLLASAALAQEGQTVPPGVVVPPPPPTPEQILAAIAAEAAAGGLVITELKPGKGDPALPGMLVAVHYTGWLQDTSRPDGKGQQFDSSRDRRQAFVFPLGQRRVIQVQRTRHLVHHDILEDGAEAPGGGIDLRLGLG